jgi:tetratricopeptide (TPR) repeat protein
LTNEAKSLNVNIGVVDQRTSIYMGSSANQVVELPKLWPEEIFPQRNINFTGRKDDLDKLKTRFSQLNPQQNRTLAITACHGLGGIGKSQLAIEFIYQHLENYHMICWILAEDSRKVKKSYRELAKDLKLYTASNKSKEVIRMIKRWLSQHPRCLLVYDNAQNYDSISDYIPQTNCDILITSRYSEWPAGIDLKIDIFSIEDAREYINKILGGRSIDSANKVDKLAETMGRLPLALAQACAYIKLNKMDIQRYLELYEESKKRYLSRSNLPAGDKHVPVYVTWVVTIREIRKKSPLAIKLLNVCAYLHSDNIPNYLFQEFSGDENYEEALGLLSSYSMISINYRDRTSSLHRLVQNVTELRQLKRDKEMLVLKEVAELLLKLFNYDKSLPHTTRQCKPLLIHVQSVINKKDIDKIVSPEVLAQMLVRLGSYYLFEHRSYDVAKEYFIRAESVIRTSNSKEALILQCETCNYVGYCYAFGENIDLAKKSAEKGMEIARILKEKGHIKEGNWCSAYSHDLLGNLYSDVSLQDARHHYVEAYSKFSAEYGTELHPDVGSAIHGLGIVLFLEKKYKEANEEFNKAYKIWIKCYSSNNHPNIGVSHNWIGKTFDALSQYEIAIENYKKAIEIREKVFLTSNHPDIAPVYHRLGKAQFKIGNYVEAKKNYLKTISIYSAIDKTYISIASDLYELGVMRGDDDLVQLSMRTDPTVADRAKNLNSPNNSMVRP